MNQYQVPVGICLTILKHRRFSPSLVLEHLVFLRVSSHRVSVRAGCTSDSFPIHDTSPFTFNQSTWETHAHKGRRYTGRLGIEQSSCKTINHPCLLSHSKLPQWKQNSPNENSRHNSTRHFWDTDLQVRDPENPGLVFAGDTEGVQGVKNLKQTFTHSVWGRAAILFWIQVSWPKGCFYSCQVETEPLTDQKRNNLFLTWISLSDTERLNPLTFDKEPEALLPK